MISWGGLGVNPAREGTYLVGARVTLQPGSQCDSTGEEENGVEQVHDDHDDRVQSPVKVERGRNQVEERQHGECSRIHGVVDGGRVACESLRNHVTDEGHDEESPYELPSIGISGL